MHEELRQLVAARLKENWSPEQIAGWLKHSYPNDEAHQVSHETIYRSLFVQARGIISRRIRSRTDGSIRPPCQTIQNITCAEGGVHRWKDTVMGRASRSLEEWLSPGHDGSGFQVWCRGPAA